MTATSARRAPRRHLAFASCAAISLLFFAVAAPARSVAQIGSQTGYQEWVPPESGDGTNDGRGGAAGRGRGGAPASGGSGGAPAGEGGEGGGGAAYGSGGGAAYGGDAGPADGRGGAAPATQPAGGGSNDEEASVFANRAGQPPTGGLTAHRTEEATGTIPLTRDNILIALAVAAVAIGAGFGVNRLARRTAGT